MRRHISFALTCATLAVVVSFTGCAVSSQSTAIATPPQTPTATAFPSPKIQTIPLSGYHVTQSNATAHGFVFNGWPDDGLPHPDGTLYYYSYDTQKITPVAVAMPDQASGNLRDIHAVQTAGDMVIYLKADNDLSYWEFDATNVVTGANYTLDTPAQDGLPATFPFTGSISTDGERVLWEDRVINNGSATNVLKVFDIASGTTKTVAQDPTNGFNAVIHGNEIAYVLEPPNMDQTTTVSIWTMSLNGGKPTQVGTTQDTVSLDLSDQYLVWDSYNGSTGVIHGIALNSGASLKLDDALCMRPLLAGDYLLCQNVGVYLMLLDIRTGAYVDFGQGDTIPYATIGDGRITWVNPDKSQAEYITLPTN